MGKIKLTNEMMIDEIWKSLTDLQKFMDDHPVMEDKHLDHISNVVFDLRYMISTYSDKAYYLDKGFDDNPPMEYFENGGI